MSTPIELALRLVVDGDRQEMRIIERNGEFLISLGTVHDGEPSLKADTHRRFTLHDSNDRVLHASLEITEVKR